jgi:hypothetical protein
MENLMPTDIATLIRTKFPLDEAVAEVWTGTLECARCKRDCSIVAGIRVSIGGYRSFFNLAELGEFQLERDVCAVLGPIAEAHRLGWQPSEARGRALFCNGCPDCGAILGEHVDLGAWACREKLGAFPIPLHMMWRRAVFEQGDQREAAKAGLPPGVC